MERAKGGKWGCRECHWVGPSEAILTAPNPFNRDDVVTGCPSCHEVFSTARLCDAEGCGAQGFPEPGGAAYCRKHKAAA